ncbi:MAG: gliding motility-associated C-terminal domain-containing protein, partial [Bacteroidales bacterium]
STGDATQQINVSQTGVYSVTVTSHLSKDCYGIDDISLQIIPDPIFDLPDAEICSHESIILQGVSNLHPEHVVKWSPGGSTLIPLLLNGLLPGQYTYTLEIEGCKSYSESMNLTVLDCELTIPNIFTPNGDGYNDVFRIENLEHFKNSYMVIYNRWGTRVYESDDYANHWWDGRNQSDGVYYFVLHVTHGINKQYKGTVTVMRGN